MTRETTRSVMPTRAEMCARLDGVDEIPVLIVGGGINGVGVFRDLSLQGVRCLIVDREDWGAGASSASSRMAHGGLRYLENGEFRLVSEATLERNRLLRNAAHGVVPLVVTVPFFSMVAGLWPTLAKTLGLRSSVRERGLVLVAAGLRIYDWLGRRNKVMPNHELGLRASAVRRFPALHPAVRGYASYYDAKIFYPERIAAELVADALAVEPAAIALNHCALAGRDGATVLLRDEIGGRVWRVRPTVVVNAGGAWIDSVNRNLAETPALIGGTKGSHLVLHNPELSAALAGSAFLWDDGAGRMCIVYPQLDKVILGSTDIRIADADLAICDAAELNYLLAAIRVIFPMVAVDAGQVCYRFCGVRPLPRSDSEATVDISRDHSDVRLPAQGDRPFPVHSLVGGKWTTFRAFAAQVTDAVLAELSMSRRFGTEDLAIGGGLGFPRDASGRAAWLREASDGLRIGAARMETLFGRYGTRARLVGEYCTEGVDRPLRSFADYTEREIGWLVEREMAVELEDIVYRRSTLALMGQITEPLLLELADLLADLLGWTEDGKRARLRRLRARLAEHNGVVLAPLPREGALETAGGHP